MRRGEKELTDETSLLPAVVQTTERGLRFEQLLFPKLHMTSEPGGVALRQHYYGYYRRAIQDALRRSSRKPLQCGGLQGYEQLVGIGQHLQQRRIQFGPDSYLDPLQERVQTAVHEVAAQAEGVRQARTFLTRVEHYLAHVPRPSAQTGDAVQTSSVPGSQVVRQELTRMFSDLAQQPVVHPIVADEYIRATIVEQVAQYVQDLAARHSVLLRYPWLATQQSGPGERLWPIAPCPTAHHWAQGNRTAAHLWSGSDHALHARRTGSLATASVGACGRLLVPTSSPGRAGRTSSLAETLTS